MNLKRSILAPAALAVLALLLLLGTADTANAQTFNPSYEITVSDTSAGANSDWVFDFALPEGDVNFAAAVFFAPPEWTITPGDEIPIGAIVGELNASATLGLLNNACANPLPVGFVMMNASTDTSDTVDYLDSDDNDTQDYAEDKDGSGLQDGIEKYPDFITRVLVDENDQPLQPIRRSAGISIVAGISVLLQFLIFEPGTFINENIPDDPELGYPSVTLLQNIGDPATDPIPGPITDFCTPLTTTNTSFGLTKDNDCTASGTLDPICEVVSAVLPEEGAEPSDPDESGVPLFTNPGEGTYTFTFIGAGQRDADADGYENSLDTCPFDPNQGNPRVAGDGDLDTDGLDGACDPNDNETNSDQDLDGYTNRQDNCSLEPNGDIEGQSNQRDTDEDQIGDDCDPNPDDADLQGELSFVNVGFDVTIGPGDGTAPQDTPTGEGTPAADGTPAGGDAEDDGGGGTVIIIIIAVIAGVVVVGGGAFYFLRGRSST